MIKLENTEVMGFEAAIRGMRNPMNSWDRSDSVFDCSMDKNGDCLNYEYVNCDDCTGFKIGTNDHNLMMKLAAGGSVHAKYRRMITVYVNITAPLYWWKEFDTYKVGTVANSCSTMHTIHKKEFTLDDFSCEYLLKAEIGTFIPMKANNHITVSPTELLERFIIPVLNHNRTEFLETKDKKYWWQMIQLLPSSYNQRRTVMLNYEVLSGIYISRKDHKLDEWREFCDWICELPYSEIITGGTPKFMTKCLGKPIKIKEDE